MRTATLVLAVLWACAACGDSHDEEPQPATKAAAGGPAGAAAPLAPIVPALPTLPAIPSVACAEDVENETRCGGRECPALPSTAALSCTVGCCTAEGQCGMSSAATLNGQRVANICIPVALPDDRCPTTSFSGVAVPGCCDATGRCGQLWASTCLSLGQGVRCDQAAADGGE
ncbi:MAG TPA: hypothetical protein VJR89_40245 [Polyangiales bacterium]|nr:hypothetical protein [Polyangiales bacterium]